MKITHLFELEVWYLNYWMMAFSAKFRTSAVLAREISTTAAQRSILDETEGYLSDSSSETSEQCSHENYLSGEDKNDEESEEEGEDKEEDEESLEGNDEEYDQEERGG